MLHVRFVNGRNSRKYTSRFRLSTGHFCRAALAIFKQQTIKNGLKDHASFNFKLHAPVGFRCC